jgi:carbonic anhydrase/acetyltransferase-like protein (isoleucine patch superfamily)
MYLLAYVSKQVELTNGCVIGASCSLREEEVVPENTIIYGSECHRREMNDKPYVSISRIIIYNRSFIPICIEINELK